MGSKKKNAPISGGGAHERRPLWRRHEHRLSEINCGRKNYLVYYLQVRKAH